MTETTLPNPHAALVTPAIEVHGISKHFKTLKAVDEVSFDVPRGSIFGFLGPNGAGKSTLIRILTGLIRSDAGSFNILGTSSHKGHLVRQGMSALVDRADFYKNLTAAQNMKILGRLTGHAEKERINELLDLLGLYERRHDKVKTYSQGMKQRLGLAQALLPDPQLLVLDEPTTGLDPQGMHEIRDFILKIAHEKQVTIFLSSHLLHEVELICSHIAMIFNGRIAAQGEMGSLFSSLEKVTVEIEVDQNEKTRNFLESSDLISELKTHATALSVEIEYKNIPELIRQLTAQQIDIFSISQRNRLESFFLSLMEHK